MSVKKARCLPALCLLWALPLTAAAGEKIAKGTVTTGGKLHVRRVKVDGVEYRVEIQFFKTPHEGRCWDAVGRDKRGNIYLGVSSGRSNSHVYKFNPRTAKLRYLGDLLSNVRYGGRDGSGNGKIHSPFREWTDGCMYFTSHYESERRLYYGGHLWKYDPKADKIVDMGVPTPRSTIFSLSRIDPLRGVTYMGSTMSGVLIRYDLRKREFTEVTLTANSDIRKMPMDNQGNFYLIESQRIRKYDPKTERLTIVAEHKDTEPARQLTAATGFCWTRDRKRLYFISYKIGALFRFTPQTRKIEALGRIHPGGKDLYLHSIHLNKAENRIYALGARNKRGEKGFYMYDLTRKKAYKLFSLDDIIGHELKGKVRPKYAFIDFADHGGLTGDDGTMYYGFHGGGRDPDLDSDGRYFAALVAVRVKETALSAKDEGRKR